MERSPEPLNALSGDCWPANPHKEPELPTTVKKSKLDSQVDFILQQAQQRFMPPPQQQRLNDDLELELDEEEQEALREQYMRRIQAVEVPAREVVKNTQVLKAPPLPLDKRERRQKVMEAAKQRHQAINDRL